MLLALATLVSCASCHAGAGPPAQWIPPTKLPARSITLPGAAVSTILKVMVDPSASAASRVRAADSVLDHATKGIEVEDIQVRLSELERTVRASGHNR